MLKIQNGYWRVLLLKGDPLEFVESIGIRSNKMQIGSNKRIASSSNSNFHSNSFKLKFSFKFVQIQILIQISNRFKFKSHWNGIHKIYLKNKKNFMVFSGYKNFSHDFFTNYFIFFYLFAQRPWFYHFLHMINFIWFNHFLFMIHLGA